MPVTVRGRGPRDGFPDYVTAKLKRDRTGVFTGTAIRHFKLANGRSRILTSWLDPRNAPDPGWGIPCVEAEGVIRDGIAIVDYLYEGTDEASAPSEDEVTYELDGTMGDKRIETHPAFERLKSKFGWDDDLRAFAEFLPSEEAAQGLAKGGESAGKRSPLAGVDSWFFVGVVFRVTWAARIVPASLLASIGTIISNPPNIVQFQLPRTSKKRKWLVGAPKLLKRGNGVQITAEYLLSEPGGLPEAIYSAGQLGETSATSSGSLITGSLTTGSL